jgi:hypothetical protein
MDLWKRLAIHLPSEKYLVSPDLSPWYADDVVVDLPLFEIGICSKELDVLAAFL